MALKVKLTKTAIERLSGDAWDTLLPGFGVRVSPKTGRKVFTYVYRMRGASKLERLTIGSHGAITAEQARRIAEKAAGDVAHGRNPAGARRDQRAGQTVRELGVAYLDQVRAKLKPTTQAEHIRRWERHVLPALGTTAVANITTAQVAALHRKLASTPYEANRVLALVAAFITFAEQQGERGRGTDPTVGIEPYTEKSRERFLTPEEVQRLTQSLNRAEREGLPPAPTRRRQPKAGATAKHRPKSADSPTPANPYAVAALRFLLLTGWRERETLTVRWSDIDFRRGLATLPDTKTGKSHRPIGAAALALLSDLPRDEGNPYVFVGAKAGQPLVEINRVWYAVRAAAGLEDVRLHDLRHAFASVVVSAGGSLPFIAALLGHRDVKTTAKYAHLLADPLRAVADQAAAQIVAWGSSAPPEADVIPIARARR